MAAFGGFGNPFLFGNNAAAQPDIFIDPVDTDGFSLHQFQQTFSLFTFRHNSTVTQEELNALSREMKKLIFFCLKRSDVRTQLMNRRVRDVLFTNNNAEDPEQISRDYLKKVENYIRDHANVLNLDHAVVKVYLREAIIHNDEDFLRIFVEYGVDISEMDQYMIVEWIQTKKQRPFQFGTIPVAEEVEDEQVDTLSMPRYLIETLGIDIYDIETELPPRHALNAANIDLNLFRYLLGCHGQFPDYHSHGHRIDIVLDSDMVGFIRTLIDNDLIARNNGIVIDELKAKYGELRNPRKALAITKSAVRSNIFAFNSFNQKSYRNPQGFCDRLKDFLWKAPCGEDLLLRLLEMKQLDDTSYRSWRTLTLLQPSNATYAYAQAMVQFEDEGSLTDGIVDPPIPAQPETDPETGQPIHRYVSKLSFKNCPRAKLIEEASSVGFERIVMKVLDVSRFDDAVEHRRLVNYAMLNAGTLSLLKYLVEVEGADVNYIDIKTGDTVLFAVCRNLSDDSAVVEAIKYLYEDAYFVLTDEALKEENEDNANNNDDEDNDDDDSDEEEDEEKGSKDKKKDKKPPMAPATALKEFCSGARVSCIDALLSYGYGYQMDIVAMPVDVCVDEAEDEDEKPAPKRNRRLWGSTPRRAVSQSHRHDSTTVYQSTRCSNIDEFRLVSNSYNPLLYIAANQLFDPSGILLKHFIEHHGADVNARDSKNGNTAVIYAAKNNDWELVRQLVSEYKADIRLTNVEGESAVSLAGMHKKMLLDLVAEEESKGKGKKGGKKRKAFAPAVVEYD